MKKLFALLILLTLLLSGCAVSHGSPTPTVAPETPVPVLAPEPTPEAPAPAGPRMDPSFDFDWELLMEQNRISTLARLYKAIKIEYSYEPERATWIFDRGGDLCVLNTAEDALYGEYRGTRFELGPDENGVVRVRVTAVDLGAGSWEANDALLTDLFALTAEMVNEGVVGDRIRIRSVTAYGYRQDFEIDRGTLALRQESYYYDGELASQVTVSYPDTLPDFSFLDGWDRPLRRVTAVWEDFYAGAPHVRVVNYELPDDWEFLPWEGRYGDYTIYMNEGYTRLYSYPGDGMNYTLYLTTAKG